MTEHRFFIDPDHIERGRVSFPSEAGRQIRTVLRLRAGEVVIVLDDSGSEHLVRLDEVRGAVTGTVELSRPNAAEPRHQVTLYQAMLKGAKLEMVLQKCTEIGVTRFVPVISARSVAAEPGESRQRRYEAIVREAAEQSRRGKIPRIEAAMTWPAALSRASERGPVILPWEAEDRAVIGEVRLAAPEVALIVGPEGGLSPEEVALARAHGAQVITLGRRILRAETAAIVTATLVLSVLGELG